MTWREHIRKNWQLALPVMLSQLGHVMMGVADNVMVGHVGVTSLAAAGLALVAFNVLFLFGIGVSFAITPLVASAHGENNDDRITSVLKHGLVVNTINGMVLCSVVWMGQGILYHLNQPDEVVALAIPYLRIVSFSLIPVMVFQSFKQFAEGLSRTRVAMVVVLLTNVLNITLNYILIYGHLGFDAMGLEGAAWATLVSRVVMMLMIALYIHRNTYFRKYRMAFVPGGYSRALFVTLLNLGIPSGLQFIFEVIAFDFSLVMMGWLGAETQAAHQIAINMATVSYMTTSGLAAAAAVRVGYFLGSGDPVNLRKAAYSLLTMALFVMFLWSILFIGGRHWLPQFYVADTNVIEIASSLLIIAGLFQLADGTQVVCASALRGLQDVKIPSLFILVAYWIIGLPLGYVLGFRQEQGAQGIWMGLLTGLTLTAIALFLRFRLLSKRVGNRLIETQTD